MTNEDAIMTNEDAISVIKMMMPPTRRGDGKSTTHLLQTLAISMAIDALHERKTGKWIRVDSNTFKCSKCGNFLNFHGVNAGRGDANYCPNCGAKMEGDE